MISLNFLYTLHFRAIQFLCLCFFRLLLIFTTPANVLYATFKIPCLKDAIEIEINEIIEQRRIQE